MYVSINKQKEESSEREEGMLHSLRDILLVAGGIGIPVSRPYPCGLEAASHYLSTIEFALHVVSFFGFYGCFMSSFLEVRHRGIDTNGGWGNKSGRDLSWFEENGLVGSIIHIMCLEKYV